MILEVLPVFLVTLLVVSGLVFALTFGKPPSYRPNRENTLLLLKQVIAGEADARRWDLFLGMPIRHDELLEEARQSCVIFHEGLDGKAPAREGFDNYIYDRAGRERIQDILNELERRIRDDPITREF